VSESRAWRVIKSAYCRRVCGMSVGQDVDYDGPLPIDAIVAAAPLPASSSVDAHRECWRSLRVIFDEEVANARPRY
jgi:hypothetical protein